MYIAGEIMNEKSQTEELGTRFFDIAEASVRGGLFLFTGNTLATIISAITSILIARLLGAFGYGLYSVSLIAPSFLSIFVDLGVNSALVKYCAEFRTRRFNEQIVNLVKTSFLFKAFLSGILFFILFCFSDQFATHFLRRPYISSLVRIASVLIVLQMLYYTSSSVFIGLDKMEYNAVISVLQSFFKLFLASILILLGFGVLGAVIGHITGYLVAGFVALLLVYNLCKKFRIRSKPLDFWNNVKFMIKYGFPLYFSGLLMGFLSQFQMIALAWFVSDFDIGNFRAASNFLSLLGVVIIPVSTALFPAFSKFNFKEEKSETEKFFRYSLEYVLLLLVPVALFVGIVSKDLVFLVYGREFVPATSYLSFLITIYFYSGISIVINSFLNGVGRTDVTFRINLINFLVSLPLVYFLTMFYGVFGLIASMIASGLAALIYGLLTIVRDFSIRINFHSVLRIYLSTFLSGFLSFICSRWFFFSHLLDLILVAFVFFTSYLVLVPVIGAVDERDIEILKSIFGRIKFLAFLVKVVLRFESWLLKLCRR